MYERACRSLTNVPDRLVTDRKSVLLVQAFRLLVTDHPLLQLSKVFDVTGFVKPCREPRDFRIFTKEEGLWKQHWEH